MISQTAKIQAAFLISLAHMHELILNTKLSEPAQNAVGRLKNLFAQYKRVMIAFSGGMDSSFLALAASIMLPEHYRAVLVNSPFMSGRELRIARDIATRRNLVFTETMVNQLQAEDVTANDLQRCYHCKMLIFRHLLGQALPGEILCEGSVTDDNADFRPGKRAIEELGIASPLQAAGFSKALITEVLQSINAGEIVRPGQSCLATRIATGNRISDAKLRQIELGEEILQQAGLSFCRLRHHGKLARIESAEGEQHLALDIAKMHAEQLASLGFDQICIDAGGYQRGSMNKPGQQKEYDEIEQQ